MENGRQRVSEQVKVAVIGCGYWGPNLVRNFHQLPTADLVERTSTGLHHLQEIPRISPVLYPSFSYSLGCLYT